MGGGTGTGGHPAVPITMTWDRIGNYRGEATLVAGDVTILTVEFVLFDDSDPQYEAAYAIAEHLRKKLG